MVSSTEGMCVGTYGFSLAGKKMGDVYGYVTKARNIHLMDDFVV